MLTLLEARTRFFARAALGPDGGYGARWVRVEAKPLSFYFPNTRARVAAAELHDLHHIATGYRSDWHGEAEIAAWELAAGCGRYAWAWALNLGAFGVGLLLFPRHVWAAFLCGRRARTLYHLGFSSALLGTVSVGWLRRQLAVRDATPVPVVADYLAFGVWVALAVLYYAPLLGLGIGALLWTYSAMR